MLIQRAQHTGTGVFTYWRSAEPDPGMTAHPQFGEPGFDAEDYTGYTVLKGEAAIPGDSETILVDWSPPTASNTQSALTLSPVPSPVVADNSHTAIDAPIVPAPPVVEREP